MSERDDEQLSGLDIAFMLWAKTDSLGTKPGNRSGRWHALPYHLLDVGAAAAILWEYLPHASRAVAIEAFGDEATARRCVIFLAATHDIGKANRFFQAKDARQIDRLSALGVVQADEQKKHGQATTALLGPWLRTTWGWGPKPSSSVAVAVGGHHGVFRNDLDRERLELERGYVPMVADALFTVLGELYGVHGRVHEPRKLNPFLAWLSGFVSVADWLGSHEQMTVWCDQPGDIALYAGEAKRRAARLLRSIEWASPRAGNSLKIDDLVPSGSKPNDLQNVAGQVAIGDFGLAIVEAPTGEGKSEAAFALCETGRSSGSGLYFALPTMATANGLYPRVQQYLDRAIGDKDLETRLLHSQAWLYRSDVQTSSNPGQEDLQDMAEDWFAGGKRGLLAPYGVGTIDQCLIGALRAKHGFVRLFALAGKTVVVDEVHAYDVYMSDLLERLLGWLRALGCRVVLLSATLPRIRKQALVRSWGGSEPADQIAYPCITWVNHLGESTSRPVEVLSRKPVQFMLIPNEEDNAWRAGANHLMGLVQGTERFGALILNTVKDAQEAFAYLSKSSGSGIRVDLFHARYTMQDRALKEKEVLRVYGKHGTRGQARILVATQVVEQSLDLDFDYMVSALAPIDLLIQRAGRLHRHRRTNKGQLRLGSAEDEPDQRVPQALYVLRPKLDASELPDIEDRIYAHDVLMKTLAYVERGFTIREPKDVSTAVDTVYDASSPESDRAEWIAKLEQASEKADANRDRYHETADEVMICEVGGWELLTHKGNALDENDETPGSQIVARTRLEELPTVSLVLLAKGDECVPASTTKEAKRDYALRTVRTPAFGA